MKQPNAVLTEAQELLKVWRDIDGTTKMGGLTADEFEEMIKTLRDTLMAFASLEAQISQVRNVRNKVGDEVDDAISRIHNSMSGTYGKKSAQMAMIKTTKPVNRRRRRDDPPVAPAASV